MATPAVSAARRSRADIQPLLDELKTTLHALYGARLAKLVLYGSFARGEATDASDIDVLAVLRGEVDEWAEIKRTSEVVYKLQLRHCELVALLPLSLRDYEQRGSPLLLNVREEKYVV